MNTSALTAFLYTASMPYAHGTAHTTAMPDGSTTITFKQGDWSFHDNFFGGEPYGGRAVIHYKHKPVWMMVYYGQIHSTALPASTVLTFLKLALQHAPKNKPYRGPTSFTQGTLVYRNRLKGTMQSYTGKEIILDNGNEIYWARYCGGLVDQDAEAGF